MSFVTFILLPIFSSRWPVEVGFQLACIASNTVEPQTLFCTTAASLPSLKGMLNQDHYQVMPILTSASPSATPTSALELNAATLVAVGMAVLTAL
jgi:hypothetical protein